MLGSIIRAADFKLKLSAEKREKKDRIAEFVEHIADDTALIANIWRDVYISMLNGEKDAIIEAHLANGLDMRVIDRNGMPYFRVVRMKDSIKDVVGSEFIDRVDMFIDKMEKYLDTRNNAKDRIMALFGKNDIDHENVVALIQDLESQAAEFRVLSYELRAS